MSSSPEAQAVASSPRRLSFGSVGGPAEVLGDIAGELQDANTSGRQLVLIHQPRQQLVGRVPPFHELADVVVRQADQFSHDHHGQPVGHGAHPFDASVAQALGPQPFCGLRGEFLHGANPLGRQMPYQQLAVHRVGRIVGGGQHMRGSAQWVHLVWHHGAVRRVDHRRGQIRGEVLGSADGVIDGVPTARGIEPGGTNLVDRTRDAHALVERIRILDGFRIEELDGVMSDGHSPRLGGRYRHVNGAATS